MENYRLEGKTFVIDDYDRLPAFSSFLPADRLLSVTAYKTMSFFRLLSIYSLFIIFFTCYFSQIQAESGLLVFINPMLA